MGSPSKRWNKLSLTRNWIFCVSGRLCQRLVDAARHKRVTAVGFEPTPLRTGALSQRRRPLGQTVTGAACINAVTIPFHLLIC